MRATPQRNTTSDRKEKLVGQESRMWLKHAPQRPHPQRGEKEVDVRPGETLTTGGDEMTPGVLTGKWGKTEKVTNTVPLPEHLGERGVAVIRPGGRRGAEEEQEREGGVGRGKG